MIKLLLVVASAALTSTAHAASVWNTTDKNKGFPRR
jgi:hypothetical protein